MKHKSIFGQTIDELDKYDNEHISEKAYAGVGQKNRAQVIRIDEIIKTLEDYRDSKIIAIDNDRVLTCGDILNLINGLQAENKGLKDGQELIKNIKDIKIAELQEEIENITKRMGCKVQ